jgi:argininosuccinate synthase
MHEDRLVGIKSERYECPAAVLTLEATRTWKTVLTRHDTYSKRESLD